MNISGFIIFATICAYFVKGMCGFANTLVFSTITSFTKNNSIISPIELILGYPSNIVIAWKERHSISAKIGVPLSLLVIAGSIPGALFLKTGEVKTLKIIFGLVIVLTGVEMFFREQKREKKLPSKLFLASIGILSGVLCGLFGICALLAAFVSRTTENTKEFKGNICVVFLIENTFRIFLYSITGIMSSSIIMNATYLMPFMVLGLLSGMYFSKKINEKIVKKIIILLLILSGIALIIFSLDK